jgi:hypothetical protein
MRLILFFVLALISVSQTAAARSYTCEMQSAMLYEADGEPKKWQVTLSQQVMCS